MCDRCGSLDGNRPAATYSTPVDPQPGGRITGRLVFADGVQATLEVDAQLAGGGVYQGSVVVS